MGCTPPPIHRHIHTRMVTKKGPRILEESELGREGHL